MPPREPARPTHNALPAQTSNVHVSTMYSRTGAYGAVLSAATGSRFRSAVDQWGMGRNTLRALSDLTPKHPNIGRFSSKLEDQFIDRFGEVRCCVDTCEFSHGCVNTRDLFGPCSADSLALTPRAQNVRYSPL
jgi:hypothetical protein